MSARAYSMPLPARTSRWGDLLRMLLMAALLALAISAALLFAGRGLSGSGERGGSDVRPIYVEEIRLGGYGDCHQCR